MQKCMGAAMTTKQCDGCDGAAVQRLYLHRERVDVCRCSNCGAEWDERPDDRRPVSGPGVSYA